MRKVLLIILVFIGIIGIIFQFGAKPLERVLGVQARSGLRVESTLKSRILVDGKEVGTTPFQDENLIEGEYMVELHPENDSTSSASWKGYVKLNAGTLTVVNRELGAENKSQTGEVITLEKGKGVTVVSIPPEAEVNLDGTVVGRTPLTISEISSGEHQFIISKENFVRRSIRATLVDSYNLVLTVDLAIAEADLTQLPTIPTTSTSQVVVRRTPTGFLRVRSTPNTNGVEVAQVKPGDVLTLLEELPNWNRVRLPGGKEGYVASAYTEKKAN